MRAERKTAGCVPLVVGLPLLCLACGTQNNGPDGGPGPDMNTTGDCGMMRDAGSMDATGPRLTSLQAGLPGNTLALQPAFSPGIFDYYIQCGGGANSVAFKATASSGANASVAIEAPGMPRGTVAGTGTPSATQDLSLTVQENGAIVVTASEGGASQEYWVRCLSSTFPQMEWVVHSAGCGRTPGYYLVGDEQPIGPNGAAYAIIYDTNGVPVWYRQESHGVFDVDVIRPGTLSFMAATPPPEPEAWEIHDWKTGAVHYVTTSDNHEIAFDSRTGHYLVFTDNVQNGVDLTGYSLPLPDGGTQTFGPNSAILPCDVLEYDTSGHLVRQWIGTDHFDPVKDSVYQQPGPTSLFGTGGIPVEDPLHCNSIDIDPANGNLLISARNMDAVFYLEWPSGKVLWKMGGTRTTKDGEAYVTPADPFHRQHDARLLPGWDAKGCSGGKGQISMFDDETDVGRPARGVIYDVRVGSGPSCAPGAAVAWDYDEPLGQNSVYMGSFRLETDGSRVIGWGFGGELRGLILSEVDATGHDLVDLVWPDSASYRAIKEPLSAFDLETLRLTSAQ